MVGQLHAISDSGEYTGALLIAFLLEKCLTTYCILKV